MHLEFTDTKPMNSKEFQPIKYMSVFFCTPNDCDCIQNLHNSLMSLYHNWICGNVENALLINKVYLLSIQSFIIWKKAPLHLQICDSSFLFFYSSKRRNETPMRNSVIPSFFHFSPLGKRTSANLTLNFIQMTPDFDSNGKL